MLTSLGVCLHGLIIRKSQSMGRCGTPHVTSLKAAHLLINVLLSMSLLKQHTN